MARSGRARRAATPLARALGGAAPAPRPTALDAFAIARERWLAGERLDIGKIAEELGVARATVFRWVGSREALYGEVISALFAAELERALRAVRGAGAARVASVTARLLHGLAAAAPLRRFVTSDPELAIRVLMSRESPVERRTTQAVRALLAEEADAGRIRPAMGLDELAYLIVRIGESFLYRDLITGEPPDVDTATRAIAILVSAEPGRRPRRSS